MKWEPIDVIRFVALIGAMLLLALGAFMMWQGIAAEGAIDIKSSVLSGSIKTGSAGLFIAFLSFAVIVFVLSSLGKRSTPTSSMQAPHDHSKSKRVANMLLALFVGFVVAGGLGSLGYGQGFVALAIVFGFMLFFGGIAYLNFLENE